MREILVTTEEFKDSPVGKIPKDWDCLSIKDCLIKGLIVDVQDGNHGEAHPKSEDFVTEGIPFVMAKDLVNRQINLADCNKISWKQYKSLRVGFAQSGDVLLSHKGTIGLTAIVPSWLHDVMLTPQVTYYRIAEGKQLLNIFIFWFFNSPIFQQKLQILSAQSTRSYIGITLQKTLLIFIPPVNEQQKIAEILDAIDKAIALTDTHITKLKKAKAGLLHDLLTRGIDEHGELRDYTRNPELFKRSLLGIIPKDWDYVKVADIANDVTDGDHHTPKRTDSGIFLLSARNILHGKLALKDVDFVPEYEYERMIRRCYPESGDILISCSGTIGRVCEVPYNFKCVLVRSAALIKLNTNKCFSNFIEATLQSNIVQSQILVQQLQAAQPNLFQGAIKCLIFPLPSMKEQKRIAKSLIKFNSQISSKETRLEKLKLLKKGLMSDLLTGRVRVKI